MQKVQSVDILSVIGRIHFSTRNFVWFEYKIKGETFHAVFSRFLPACYPVVDGKIVREERFKWLSPHAFIMMRHDCEKSIKSIIHVLGFSLVDWEALGNSYYYLLLIMQGFTISESNLSQVTVSKRFSTVNL
jgi:hypothetical protein